MHFLQTSCIISEYGSLVKRLRRRPLTAKTGVRFPYELLQVRRMPLLLKNPSQATWFVGQAAKTSPSHGENRGSIPLRTADAVCFYRKVLHGSLVKRLRRRPLTAKTGVRFPYELFNTDFSHLKILFYIIWFVGQEAKTSPSHGENRGSIPLRTAFKTEACMAPFFCCADFFLPIINASKKARQFSAGLFLFF